jgi:hypothetical protein
MKLLFGCGAVALCATALVLADDKKEALRSGPQVGDLLPGTFEVRNCNGPDAGDTNCLV